MSEPHRGVHAYHHATKHHLHRFALGPGYLDWDTQPDPFRRYDGARLLDLDLPPTSAGPRFDEAMTIGAVGPATIDRASISRLFLDSLAISAWKQAGLSRWALRVNPSSGNLHPTEGYLVSGPIPGLVATPVVCHYAPREHGLELRAAYDLDTWRALVAGFPDETILVGLTSIHWREAWKYGERAYRYCQHDVGHAIAAVSIAASGLGWQTTLLDELATGEIAALLGTADPQGCEPEAADCVLALHPPASDVPRRVALSAIERIGAAEWHGAPNPLSPGHVAWPIIDAVAAEAEKPATSITVEPLDAKRRRTVEPRSMSLGEIVHQRRSAVAFDRHTSMPRDVFYRILSATVATTDTAGLAELWWRPRVHLALFVHRVDGLTPGLYLAVRNATASERLRALMAPEFDWSRPEACPPELDLWLLAEGDCRRVSAEVSCRQDIASDGCFSLGMLAEFREPIARFGQWFYPRLFWETGAIGQILYLEGEAAGFRATGIGCFFDDAVHEVFGLDGDEFQSLYHFTIGRHVEDTRLTTLPAYDRDRITRGADTGR